MPKKRSVIFFFILTFILSYGVPFNAAVVEKIPETLDECTAIAVGKKASADGSTMITHNDDSSIADFRLWLIPERSWSKDEKRDIVVYSHDYVDYGVYPPNYPDKPPFGKGAKIVGKIPQIKKTNAYLHSRYSFLNDKGLAMSETTLGIDKSTEYGKEVHKVMIKESTGLIDCWFAQDLALERTSTARKAIRLIGDMVEKYGWASQNGECILATDGNEVWIAEFYGRDIWVAFRLPDDQVFVSANRARIDHVDFDDDENYMYSPNLVSFAINKGWYDPKGGKAFQPNSIYCPSNRITRKRRVWRAYDLMAHSLGLKPDDSAPPYPLTIKPDQKLSVNDIFKIKGDYYEGTDYSLTINPGEEPTSNTQLAGGPFGNPMRGSGFERSIGIHRTCYVHVSQVKGWLPDEIKGISWFGYGHPASGYITPLFATMKKLPKFYSMGSRADIFRRDSGWWVNIYTQAMAELRWNESIKSIREYRDPLMVTIYKEAEEVQKKAAEIIKKHNEENEDDEKIPEEAIELIHNFAYNTANTWHENWKYMGDLLLTHHWAASATSAKKLPKWWLDLTHFKPLRGHQDDSLDGID